MNERAIHWRTPDQFLQFSLDIDEYESMQTYICMLFVMTTMTLEEVSPREESTYSYLRTDLLLSPHRSSIPLAQLREALQYADLRNIEINYNALPETPGMIAYEPLSVKFQGALNGLTQLLTIPTKDFYTPGMVLDMRHCIGYCELSGHLVKDAVIRDALGALRDFLQKVIESKQGLMITGPFTGAPETPAAKI